MEDAKKFRWQSHENFQTRSKNGKNVLVDVSTPSMLSPRRKLAALAHFFRPANRTQAATAPLGGLKVSSPGEPIAMSGPGSTSASPFPLSHQETAVLRLMVDGKNTKEMGAKLFICPVTVRNHFQNIFRKLDVHTRLEARMWALRPAAFSPRHSPTAPTLATLACYPDRLAMDMEMMQLHH